MVYNSSLLNNKVWGFFVQLFNAQTTIYFGLTKPRLCNVEIYTYTNTYIRGRELSK